MLSWLFGIGRHEEAKLILRPHVSIVGSPGFPTSASDLTLTASAGETIGTVLDRFNTYRGPSHQIVELYKPDDTVLPLSTVLRSRETVIAIVKKA
jgi:hypothetical protein